MKILVVGGHLEQNVGNVLMTLISADRGVRCL